MSVKTGYSGFWKPPPGVKEAIHRGSKKVERARLRASGAYSTAKQQPSLQGEGGRSPTEPKQKL